MNRLLPKDDYFKTTTRRILSDREKQKIIEAVDRAAGDLNRRMSSIPLESTSDLHDLKTRIANLRTRMCFFSQAVSLVKGSTQPRHLYRRSRIQAIEFEALDIAEETGADFLEVRRVFLARMDEFIS